MRQKSSTPDDLKLRTALENMRYKACTPEDIAFLRTRVASDRPGHPHLDSKEFRNVSVITAWNVHKDAINQLGAERFAQDTDQVLHEFYSIDRLSPKDVDPFRFKGCEQTHLRRIGPHLQQQLWDAIPASTNDHVPGCLRLCIGMPVMIKANNATELCITKGQEGIVKGWTESSGPHGKRVLETLFIELTNPPRPIQIKDLPPNVVPIPRTTTRITALLEDDTLLSLNRDQVLVLQNFSMTDYGAQGKSRIKNVCHLNNCKSHLGYYVALSRGTTAEGTAIIQGFHESKITGGLNGYLRQEFRELELLDEITQLRTTGQLPPQVTGIYRGQLLASYRKWKKSNMADNLHPALRQGKGDDPANGTFKVYDDWKPNKEANKAPKRKAGKDASERSTKKVKFTETNQPSNAKQPNNMAPIGKQNTAAAAATNVRHISPIGLIWDNQNWSCGYDALLTPLGHLWRSDRYAWTAELNNLHPMLGLWANLMQTSENSPEIARDNVRALLTHFQPAKFPQGRIGINLDDLFQAMTNSIVYGSAQTYCEVCNYNPGYVTDTFGMYLTTYRISQLNSENTFTLSRWLSLHLDRLTSRQCPWCIATGTTNKLRRRTNILNIPALVIFSITNNRILVDDELSFQTLEGQQNIRLAGLIYHSSTEAHFTSIVVDPAKTMWYHDGMTTQRNCHNIGSFNTIDKLSLHTRGAYKLSAAIYARALS
ncbi:hypothetical protein B0H13DRAFT_1621511 [Mycena leptocephala]|nr:hypothetical protein B0H13DRAFT_1621511 [Mycena leptocephala]